MGYLEKFFKALSKSKFYDGRRLLSSVDINGNSPEIFICTGNRTAGKSFFFKMFLFCKWLDNPDEKVLILFRKKPEIAEASGSFFKDILEHPIFQGEEIEISTGGQHGGIFTECYVNDKPFAYFTYFNAAEQIKRISSYFVDVRWMLFDEMQSETYSYVENEVSKLISIHVSVSRGQGKHSRFVPVILIGNTVSIVNPYFVALGIVDRWDSDTKFLRGDGYICEFISNETAAKAIKTSTFNRAFASTSYISYAADNSYLMDSDTFVERVQLGKGCACVCYFVSGNKCIGLWMIPDHKYYFCAKYDPSRPQLAIGNSSHNQQTILASRHLEVIKGVKRGFDAGSVLFETQHIKKIILQNLFNMII